MGAINEEDVIKVDYYNSIIIQEYNGKISLNAVDNGQNDTFYLKWVFLSRWSKTDGGPVPGDKKMPMGLRLSNKETAIKVLETVLVKIRAMK